MTAEEYDQEVILSALKAFVKAHDDWNKERTASGTFQVRNAQVARARHMIKAMEKAKRAQKRAA